MRGLAGKGVFTCVSRRKRHRETQLFAQVLYAEPHEFFTSPLHLIVTEGPSSERLGTLSLGVFPCFPAQPSNLGHIIDQPPTPLIKYFNKTTYISSPSDKPGGWGVYPKEALSEYRSLRERTVTPSLHLGAANHHSPEETISLPTSYSHPVHGISEDKVVGEANFVHPIRNREQMLARNHFANRFHRLAIDHRNIDHA